MRFIDFITGGFYTAFTQFLEQQKERDMALSDKVALILEGQQASQELVASLNETITGETAQVAGAIASLAESNQLLAQLIAEKDEQIKQLFAQVDAGETSLAEAEAALDIVLNVQQAQMAAQKEAIAKIADIFTPETSVE